MQLYFRAYEFCCFYILTYLNLFCGPGKLTNCLLLVKSVQFKTNLYLNQSRVHTALDFQTASNPGEPSTIVLTKQNTKPAHEHYSKVLHLKISQNFSACKGCYNHFQLTLQMAALRYYITNIIMTSAASANQEYHCTRAMLKDFIIHHKPTDI